MNKTVFGRTIRLPDSPASIISYLGLLLVLVLSALPAGAAEPWEVLPPTPAPINTERSDGAILGLDLAMRHAGRVGKIFAFAANTMTSGVKESVEKNPTFATFIERARHEVILDARAQVMFSQSLKKLPISGRGSMNYLKKL